MKLHLQRQLFLFVFFIALSLKSTGQERFLKRAQEALEKGEVELVETNLKSYELKEGKKPESYFIRHWLVRKNATTKEELDQAKNYLELAVSGYSAIASKNQQEWCKEINFCEEEFSALESQIDSLLFEKVKSTSNKEDIEWFLNKYPYSQNAVKANNWKTHLLFLDAKKTNTEEGYTSFLKTFPNHEDSKEAVELLWQAAWEKATLENSIKAYQGFIKKYPTAVQREKAQLNIIDISWKNAEKTGTEEAYLTFINEFPRSLNANLGKEKAEALGWNRLSQSHSAQDFLNYAKKYPLSKFKTQAIKKAEEISWQEAVNSSDNRKLKEFINNFPSADSIEVAKTILQERVVDVLPWLTASRKYRLYNIDNNKFVNEILYDEIIPASPNRFVVCREQKQGIIDKLGNTILPSNYEKISIISANLYQVGLNNKLGVMNANAEIIIPFQYDQIEQSPKGHFIVGKTTNGQTKYGLLNKEGKQLLPIKYSKLEYAHDSLFIASIQESLGIIGEQGSTLITYRFEEIDKGIGEQWIVKEKGKWGIVQSNGVFKIKPIYDYFKNNPIDVSNSSNNFYIGIIGNEKEFLLDSAGNTLLTIAGSISYLGGELFKVAPPYSGSNSSDNCKIFNASKRSYVTDRKFGEIGNIGEGKLWVSESGRSGYIDTNGKEVTAFIFADDAQINNPQEYGEEGDHGEGDEFYFEKDEQFTNKCNIYNISKEEDFISYSNIWTMPSGVFFGGYAAVNIEGKVGFINAKGNIKIQPRYEQATPFWNGVAEVVKLVKIEDQENWIHQLIDTTGNVLAENSIVQSFSQKKGIAVLKNDKWGDEAEYELFDLNTKQKKYIGKGFSAVNVENGYFKGYYKDVEVFITEDGTILMSNSIDFSNYEAGQLADEAVSLYYADKWDEAIQKAKTALNRRPDFLRAIMVIASSYKSKEYHSEVVKWLNKAVEISPLDMNILTKRKEYYYEKKYWSDALSDLRTLTQLESDSYIFWFERGYAEGELNYHDQAISSYTKALSINRNNSGALNNRGNAYLAKGMAAQALLDFNEGIKNTEVDNKEDLGRLYNNRGIALIRLKRNGEACQSFQRANTLGFSSALQNIRYYCSSK